MLATRHALVLVATAFASSCGGGMQSGDATTGHDGGDQGVASDDSFDTSALLDTSTDDTTASPTDATADVQAPIDVVNTADTRVTVPCAELGTANPWQNALGTHTLADRGQVLSCVHAATFTRDQVTATPYFQQHAWRADNGYDLYVIQYVSEGSPGEARAVSALLYLPQGGAMGVPIAAVDHGTSGMGPSCGPSHATVVADYMAVPLVGHGYAVVATDYAAMGVDDGIAPYGVGVSEGTNAIDSVRALRNFHDARFDAQQLGGDLFVMGHSQGGQAALFTHQLYDASLGVTLRGSISFAPGFGDLRGLNTLFTAGHAFDAASVFVLMGLYGHAVFHRMPAASTWLTPAAAAVLPGMLHDQCLTQLLGSIPSRFPSYADVYTASFIAAADTCAFTAPCPGFQPWADELAASVPGSFGSTAPALILQGERDTTVSPASTQCIVRRLTQHGTSVSACGYAADDHLSIVGSAMPDALRWMTARRMGTSVDVCTAPIAEACP